MADNLVYKPGYQLSVVCSSPTTPASGDPVRYGNLTGLALVDESAGGNASGYTTVDFGPFIADLSVKAVDANGNSAISVGDALWYTDGDTPKLSKKASGYFYGFALEAIDSGDTDTINVMHIPAPGTGTLASGSIGTTQLASNAVTTAKLAAGVLSADAAGRALVATGWLDVATALAAFDTDSVANAWLLKAIANGAFQADTNTRALFADEIWTEAKITPASLTGLVAKVIADANVIGALPLIHRKTMASGADANVDIALTYKSRVIRAWFVMKGAGTTGCTLQLKNVTTAITEAYNCASSSDKDLCAWASIDDAQQEITAGTNLRISSHSTGGDFPGAEVYVEVVRV